MPTIHEWLDGKTRDGVMLDPEKVASYRSRRVAITTIEASPTYSRPVREVAQKLAFPCVHRGAKIREDESNLCGSRGQQTSIFACARHGECSLGRYCQQQTVRRCNTCHDRDMTRHLIAHIYPRRGNWQWNVTELLKRIDVFNGTRSVGIVTDSTTDAAADVRAAFDGHRIDRWIELPNNPKQREGVTFFPLMEGLPHEAGHLTWYWHGKSAQYGDGITRHWAEVQNRVMLDGWRDVQANLEQYPITGTFKRYDGWQAPNASKWHYTGTAFAFRNTDVFSRNWRRLSRMFFCVEFWPPTIFKSEEAGCVFGDGASDLYKWENWEKWNQQLAEKYESKLAVEQLLAETGS